MSSPSTTISHAQAEALMSLLLDGELPPADAARLEAYLQEHPEALNWLENWDALRGGWTDEITPNTADQLDLEARVAAAAAQRPVAKPTAPGSLIPFPKFLKPLAAAAGLAVAGSLLWLGLRPEESAIPSGSASSSVAAVVEFVDTDIPNASTFVYTDEESGWIVVWVESMAPLPAEHG